MAQQRSLDFLKRLSELEDTVKIMGVNQHELAELVSQLAIQQKHRKRAKYIQKKSLPPHIAGKHRAG